jgi:hypothetical protein
MFRQFAGSIPAGARTLFSAHPLEITSMLEKAWHTRIELNPPVDALAAPIRTSLLNPFVTSINVSGPTRTNGGVLRQGVLWDHLIYAYMIENTRVYEIFRRVLHEFFHGEKLGIPTTEAQLWLRNTEELFYRDGVPFSIVGLQSHVRPDMGASRRNAYFRMFGMDLNHGSEDGRPYSYVKADAFNNEFVNTFEELLRETWVAYANRGNINGPKPTDPGKLTTLVKNLQNMLTARRTYGNLAREEFACVAMMSWMHLTLESNFPIVEVLSAQASSPEQRLFKIAQRVGVPAHALSQSYFDIAGPISSILINIEVNGESIVPGLQADGQILRDMNTIITHWTAITGHDVKAGKVKAA